MNYKTIILILLSIILGIICGKTVFLQYERNFKNEILENKENIYMLQQGVYSSYESMEENTANLSDFLYIKKDDKYYVYLGFTSDKDTANKLKDNYTNTNIYVKENSVENMTLVNKLKENDNSIQSESNKQSLLTFSKKSLEIYEELMNTATEH